MRERETETERNVNIYERERDIVRERDRERERDRVREKDSVLEMHLCFFESKLLFSWRSGVTHLSFLFLFLYSFALCFSHICGQRVKPVEHA